MDNSSRGKGCGRDLTILVSLLGVYANAEKVVLAHSPALKRAQCGDVIAAIAAKDAELALAKDAQAEANALRKNATRNLHPKAVKCPDLRGAITSRNGQQFVHCKGCKKELSYAGWAQHCNNHHPPKEGEAQVDDNDANDGNDGSQNTKQPKAKAAAKKTGSKQSGPTAKKKKK